MKSKRRHLKPVVAIMLLLTTASLSWWFFFREAKVPHEIIALSGRIESDDAAVAAKTQGRIKEISVREGDQVNAGQVIAMLDDDQIKAREQQEWSAVQQAEAKLQHAREEIAVLEAQLEQSRLGVTQAQVDAQGRVREAEAQVAAAEAELAQARAAFDQARYDKERFVRLAERGVIPERDGRQSITAAEAQEAVVAAAERRVEAARGALVAARAYLDNPAIRAAQASSIERQILQAQSAIASAKAEADQARARLEEARANRRDLAIIAPFDGVIATRAAEPGEVVVAGTPILTIVNLGQVYLRGFISEGEIGRVRVGQPARVFLDSNSQKPLEAFVSRIDPQASFTPENTYFRDDRVKQVVGVKLSLRNAQGFAKPGMPADGEVLVEGTQWLADSRTSR